MVRYEPRKESVNSTSTAIATMKSISGTENMPWPRISTNSDTTRPAQSGAASGPPPAAAVCDSIVAYERHEPEDRGERQAYCRAEQQTA